MMLGFNRKAGAQYTYVYGDLRRLIINCTIYIPVEGVNNLH